MSTFDPESYYRDMLAEQVGGRTEVTLPFGRADVMKTFEDIFCSFTFGGETASMAAAMKVLDILEQTDALARMAANGRRLQDGFNALAKLAGLFPRFQCIGYPVWSLLKFRDAGGKDSLLERSLFQQEVVKRGILQLVTHNMTAAHDDASTERTLEIYAAVLKTLAGWLADRIGQSERELKIDQGSLRLAQFQPGRSGASTFRRLSTNAGTINSPLTQSLSACAVISSSSMILGSSLRMHVQA